MDKEFIERFETRMLELEKHMDLIMVNQLILTECMDKVNKALTMLTKVMQGKDVEIVGLQ